MSAGKSRSQLIMLGVFVVLVLSLFGYLALRVGSVRSSDGVVVDAVFDDAQGLVENGSVRIAGIKVGSITKLAIDGKKARISLHIDPNVTVRSDVRATIKAKSLLGEKFVELIPQSETAAVLVSGDQITDTYISAELPDLASQIGPLLAQIDPKDVSRLVKTVSRILEQNEESIPRMVESFGNIAVNVDKMLQRNTGKIDQIIEATHETIVTNGPKVTKLVDTTQKTLDNANNLIEKTSPKLINMTDQLAKIDVESINKMIKDAPEMFGDAKQIVSKVNNLLDGFEGLTYADLEHLMRDQGIHVRMMERSDEEQAEARKRWEPKKSNPIAAEAKK